MTKLPLKYTSKTHMFRNLKKDSDGKSRALILFYINFLSSLVPLFQWWDLQVSTQSSSSLKLWHIDCYSLEMINSKDFLSILNIQLNICKNQFFWFYDLNLLLWFEKSEIFWAFLILKKVVLDYLLFKFHDTTSIFSIVFPQLKLWQ